MIVPFPIIMGKIPAIRINYGLFLVQKPYKNPEKIHPLDGLSIINHP